ncbi:unnamed protein product, partial [Mesorhabditis belari]|uniref:Uncharacterized protein n=1 Tax=Mesorhabditis belari TaxID=2138241 RepID=A0AAF3EBT9_9BILA
MKLIESNDSVSFPANVAFTVKGRLVHVKGPRETLVRDFRHLHMEMKERLERTQSAFDERDI